MLHLRRPPLVQPLPLALRSPASQQRHFRLAAPRPDTPDAPASEIDGVVVPVSSPPALCAIAPPKPKAVEPVAAVSEVKVPEQEVESVKSEPEIPPASAPAPEQPPPFAKWAIPIPLTRAPSLSELQARVPDEYTKKVEEWKREFHTWTQDLQKSTSKNLSLLSLKVNEVTGYREVERLKQAVKDRERDLEQRRGEAKAAKHEYEHAVLTRTTSQQNVNNLLERKHSWTDADVAEFTKLVRSDHASRHAVTTTSQDLKAAELAVDKAFTSLMQAILERYHEEQVWSDKIRSVSTWANIVALAANLIVFMGAIAFIEPWKRRRLVQGLEERMTGMMNRVDEQIRELSANVASLEAPLQATVAAASASGVAAPPVAEPAVAPVAEAAPEGEVEPTSPVTVEEVPEEHSADTETDTLPAEPSTPSPASPIEQLAASTSPQSPQSRALAWISTQLSHIAPASAERDLAAASLGGAAAGALAVGVLSLVAGSFRGT